MPPEGILEVFLRVMFLLAYVYADTAACSRSPESNALLTGLARVGGRGTEILLSFLGRAKSGPVEEVLLQYRPRELLEHCRVLLLDGNPKRSKQAISILSSFVSTRAATSRFLQKRALALLVTALDRPQPGLKAHVLLALARSADPASLPVDALKMLQHEDYKVRCAALRLLAAQGRVDVVRVAERILEDEDEAAFVRAAALSTLARLEPDRRIERTRAAMEEGNVPVLEAALESLDDVDVPDALL